MTKYLRLDTDTNRTIDIWSYKIIKGYFHENVT